jgi:hypothetical protein
VVNAGTANSMQIADVELLGFFGGTLASGTPGGPKLTITHTGANITISWTGGGTLHRLGRVDQRNSLDGCGGCFQPVHHRDFRLGGLLSVKQ